MTRLIVVLLAMSPALSVAQVNTDSLRSAQRADIDRYRAQAATAAAVFLDHARPVSDRLAAVRQISALSEPEQVASAQAIALDSSEGAAVRVRALQLIGHRAGEDTAFSRRLFRLVADTAEPVELRREAVSRLSFALFGSLAMHAQTDEFLEALRAAARDPDLQVRRAALRALAGEGDQPALQLLEQGLRDPGAALLPPSEAVQLLGLKDPAPFFDLLHQLMLQPPDSATRIAAIQLLGGHAPSRPDLVRLLQDQREFQTVRHAALGALAAGDRAGLPRVALPVVADESAPLDLRLQAIKAVELARTSRDPRVFARTPDEFDRLMEQLSSRSSKSEIRTAAQGFLARTRSPR